MKLLLNTSRSRMSLPQMKSAIGIPFGCDGAVPYIPSACRCVLVHNHEITPLFVRYLTEQNEFARVRVTTRPVRREDGLPFLMLGDVDSADHLKAEKMSECQ